MPFNCIIVPTRTFYFLTTKHFSKLTKRKIVFDYCIVTGFNACGKNYRALDCQDPDFTHINKQTNTQMNVKYNAS